MRSLRSSTVRVSASSPTSLSPIPVIITFNHSVAGFDVSKLIIGNGTASNFTGSGSTYNVDIIPTIKGNVTVDIQQGVATDIIGNTNQVAPHFAIVYDGTTSIRNIEKTSSVYTAKNAIVINESAGQMAKIYSLTGQVLKSTLLISNKETLPTSKGLYLIKIGAQTWKVLVN